jgi:hypothetical protein
MDVAVFNSRWNGGGMIQQLLIMAICLAVLGPAFHYVLDVDPNL